MTRNAASRREVLERQLDRHVIVEELEACKAREFTSDDHRPLWF